MPIPNPPPTPNRNDPATFSATTDAYLAWLTGQAVPEINAIAMNSAVNLYQEGTFTPVVVGTSTAGVGTYTSQLGRFTRIGNRVFFDVQVEWTAHTGTGNIQINGLPFTSISGNRSIPSIEAGGLTIPAAATLMARVSPSTNFISLNTFPSGGGTLAAVAMDTAANVYISGVYAAA